MVLQRKKSTLDVEDVEKIHSIKDTIDVQVVVFQRPKLGNIPGSNGTHRCKNLLFYLVH